MDTLGSIIRAAREAKGHSQAEVAKTLFVTRGAVSQWEKDVSRPKHGHLMRLAKMLDINRLELMVIENPPLFALTDFDQEEAKEVVSKIQAARAEGATKTKDPDPILERYQQLKGKDKKLVRDMINLLWEKKNGH